MSTLYMADFNVLEFGLALVRSVFGFLTNMYQMVSVFLPFDIAALFMVLFTLAAAFRAIGRE